QQFERIKGKGFGKQGVLPLAPGKYKVDFLLTDGLTHTGFRSEKEVTVPDPTAESLSLTDTIAFTDAEMLSPQDAALLPFSGAGVKFTPMVGQELDLKQGQDLSLFYQVWVPAHELKREGRSSHKFTVEYVYGRL